MSSLVQPTRLTLLATANLALVAMVPCLGWLNWAVAPLCLVPTIFGLVGLVQSQSAPQPQHPGPYLAGLLGGILLGVTCVARLGFGLGVL